MKLLLSFYLSSLFCSVYSLQCLDCLRGSGQCSSTNSVQCDTGSVCSTLRANVDVSGFSVGTTTVARSCLEQSQCVQMNANVSGITYSANLGVANVFGFISCCMKDNCNDIKIPEPDSTLNGLKCFTCNSLLDTTCNSTVSCVGNQDRCANGTIPDLPLFGTVIITPVKGCISKSFCDATPLTTISCCTGNLCNGTEAWLRLDLSLLMMILLATILQQ